MRHTVLAIPSKFDALLHVAGLPPREKFVWCGRSLLSGEVSASNLRGREIVWSGSYAEVEGGGPFEDDPRTWGPTGWEALRQWVEAEPAGTLVVRSHARHVVSDVPGCRALLDAEWARQRDVHLCFDPVSMLAAGMLPKAEDHLRRSFEALELFPAQGLSMVVVAGVDGAGTPCGLHDCGGMGKRLADLVAAWVPEGTILALLDDRVGEQLDLLAKAGA